jgi:hypothetical protein
VLSRARLRSHFRVSELERLRKGCAQGYPVLGTDEARLSAFIRGHIGIDGHYAFYLPDLGGSHRPLRDPDSRDD